MAYDTTFRCPTTPLGARIPSSSPMHLIMMQIVSGRGLIRTAVKDGSLSFLFDNKGALYHGKVLRCL
jgi:hypothetical protein